MLTRSLNNGLSAIPTAMRRVNDRPGSVAHIVCASNTVVKAGDVSNSRLARKFLELGVRVRGLGRGRQIGQFDKQRGERSFLSSEGLIK